jgi:glycosyltransferase involved in cell wall biosynthesis
MISILILTLNEEHNLPACLKSVAWSDDIVVLDSFSTDATCDIARAAGARVFQRRFDNWAAHQNWAMEHLTFSHPWVFYLDADEQMAAELREEIAAIARDPACQEVAFYCGRRNWFMGTWIRRAMPPGMIMRFFRPKYVRFERLVNPVPVIQGPHGYLRHLFDHFNFSKGLSEWIDKHNKYSLLEAIEGKKLLSGARPSFRRLFGRDRFDRRKALKELSFRMPCRPLAKFLWLYVLQRGFLDGRAGFTYCCLQAMYEYMIDIKIAELERREKGLPV